MIGRKRTRQASIDRLGGRLVLVALRLEGEVDHHDRVLLHDADEHEDADEAVDIQLLAEERAA